MLIMLIVLIVLVVLVAANILRHVHALTPYGDHSPYIWIVSSPTVGANILTYFLRSLDIVLYKFELFLMLLQWEICKGLRRSSQYSVPLKYE